MRLTQKKNEHFQVIEEDPTEDIEEQIQCHPKSNEYEIRIYLKTNLIRKGYEFNSEFTLNSLVTNIPKSLYQSASLSVSESVLICLFPNSSETANPNKLKF